MPSTRNPRWIGLLLAPALLLASACATTSTRQVELDPEVVEAERDRQRQLALQRQITYQNRLSDVAYPILTSATPLCEEDVGPVLGLRFANRHLYEDEWRDAAETALALGDTVQVVSVTENAPADEAGLRPGDRLVEVDGRPVPAGEEAVEELGERLDEALDLSTEALEVVVRRDGERETTTVTPERACDYPVQVVRNSGLNAFADGDRVIVTSTMMRFAEDDELAVILAHELAHNAMGHIEAKQQNSIFGAVLGAMADVFAATQGVSTGGAYAAQGAELGGLSHSQDFEREADYVGLYALALADLPLDDAPRFWRQMAQENPESIDFAHTHPTSAERFVRMERTLEEIREKREQGLPLRPEMEDGSEEEADGG